MDCRRAVLRWRLRCVHGRPAEPLAHRPHHGEQQREERPTGGGAIAAAGHEGSRSHGERFCKTRTIAETPPPAAKTRSAPTKLPHTVHLVCHTCHRCEAAEPAKERAHRAAIERALALLPQSPDAAREVLREALERAKTDTSKE